LVLVLAKTNMQHQIVTALSEIKSTLKYNADQIDIESSLKDCLQDTYNELPVNSVLIRNLTMLVTSKFGEHRPLELLLEIADSAIIDLLRLWKISMEDDMPVEELLKTLGLQLDLFLTRFNSMAGLLPIYKKEDIRKLLQQRCCCLLPRIEQVLVQCFSDPTKSISNLLTVIVILHRFISLRTAKIDSSLAKHSINNDSADEQLIVKRVSELPNLEQRYAEWLHRLLSEGDGATVMSSFEIVPYLNADTFIEHHLNFMIHRFINQVDHSTSLEGSIIRRITDNGADADALWRVSQLVSDLDNSRRISRGFSEIGTERLAVQPLIAQHNLWKLGKRGKHPVLPESVRSEMARYEQHVKATENYNLIPISDSGWAVIEFSVDEDHTYNVKVTMAQLAVICCFNDKLMYTAKELGKITALGAGRAGKLAMDMMRCKLLRRKPYMVGSKEVHELDSFVINPTFVHADMDFSIVALDEGDANAPVAAKWTASELRKAIRRELRAAPENKMEPADLHLCVHLTLGEVDKPSFNAAIDKMVDAELIESIGVIQPKAPKAVPIVHIPGLYCPSEIRYWLWGDDNPNREIRNIGNDLFVPIRMKLINLRIITSNNYNTPALIDLPQVFQDNLKYPGMYINQVRPSWVQMKNALRRLSENRPSVKKVPLPPMIPEVIRLL
jgi:hypothetical protein